MAQHSRSTKLLNKAEASLLAGIEVYNKPDFQYREETFAILALNAWELLLKAKLLKEKNNDPRCLYIYERRQTRSGRQSARLYARRNRTGNMQTLSMGRVIAELERIGVRIPSPVKANLDALAEIRDNAVHYMNAGPLLAKQILEIGTASVKNYLESAKRWFNRDLSNYNMYLMPIGFVAPPGTATAIATGEERNLIRFLGGLIRDADRNEKDFHVSLGVNLSFKRVATDAAVAVAITADPNAPQVQLTEEDIRRTFKWDYRELANRLRSRYIDFSENAKYHGIRKQLLQDPRYVRRRYLDPGNPNSARKDFYHPEVVTEFDRHYTRKTAV